MPSFARVFEGGCPFETGGCIARLEDDGKGWHGGTKVAERGGIPGGNSTGECRGDIVGDE